MPRVKATHPDFVSSTPSILFVREDKLTIIISIHLVVTFVLLTHYTSYFLTALQVVAIHDGNVTFRFKTDNAGPWLLHW